MRFNHERRRGPLKQTGTFAHHRRIQPVGCGFAAGHKAIVSSELSPSAEVITDLILTFTQQNGPGKCTIEFRRGQDKSVAVFYAVNGTQGAGGRVEPPDPVTVDRFAQNYIIEALEGPRW